MRQVPCPPATQPPGGAEKSLGGAEVSPPECLIGPLHEVAIDEAAKAGDADTSDLFTGISRGADKSLWLLEAHLQADR